MKKLILIVVFVATVLCFNEVNAQDSTNFQAIRSYPTSKYDQAESIITWFDIDSGYARGAFVYIMNNDLDVGTVDSVGIVAEVANVSSVDEVDFVDTVRVLIQADNLSSVDEVDFVDTVRTVLLVDTVGTVGVLDTAEVVRQVDNVSEVVNVTSVDEVDFVDTLSVLKNLYVVTELTNGHIFNSDTTQKKYRASYTLTSTGADTIWQDTAYGNFKKVYIGYSDTGLTTSAGITDSCIVELWDALLSVWKPIGVVDQWNGNHHLYISPGSGLNREYQIGANDGHYIIDIFRIRFVNTQVGMGTRTGTVSWTGKGDR